jgi:hypothetical protein
MRFTSRCYCLLMALCMAATSGVILAQSPPLQTSQTAQVKQASQTAQPGDTTRWLSCKENYTMAGARQHCELSVSLNELTQGEHHQLVGVRKYFRPLPIEQYVGGDSALGYAAAYHRAELWHGSIVFGGAGLIATSLVASHFCSRPTCKLGSTGGLARSAIYAGAGLLVVSIPFRISAGRAAHAAVDLFNASLAK